MVAPLSLIKPKEEPPQVRSFSVGDIHGKLYVKGNEPVHLVFEGGTWTVIPADPNQKTIL